MLSVLLIVAIFSLIAGATADGVSTARFLKGGQVETDPILIKLLGTNTPSTKRLFLTGATIIAFEIASGLLIATVGPIELTLVSIAFFSQFVVHLYNTIRNYNLPLNSN